MADLTVAEQRALIETFAPVMLLHLDEKFFPVDPKRYLEASALWRAAPEKEADGSLFNKPDFTDKKLWGKPPRGSGAAFPRKASVTAGDLAGLSAEAGPGKVWLGSTSDPSGAEGATSYPFELFDARKYEVWFDPTGWADSADVTAATENKAADLDEVQSRWADVAPANPLRKGKYWFCAEVVDKTGLILLLRGLSARMDDDRGRLIADLLKTIDVLEEVQLVTYDFFYPGHQDMLRPKDSAPGTAPKEILTYGGDWTGVAVLVSRKRSFGNQPPKPWEGKMIGATRHRFTNFEVSSKLRHVLELTTWDDSKVARLGATHPLIFVSQGSHSNYFSPGDHEALSPSLPDSVKDKLNEKVQEAVDKVQDKVDEAETTKDVLITIAKAAVGLAAGGLLGAVVGLVAGIIEGLATSAPDLDDKIKDKIDPDSNKGTEPGPGTTPATSSTPGIGLAILPPGVSLTGALSAGDLATQLSSQNEKLLAKETVVWQSSQLTDSSTGIFKDAEASNREYFEIIDRDRPPADPAHLQAWFPARGASEQENPGYDGRWGVRVADDKFGRRAGMQWVDYGNEVLLKLLSPKDEEDALNP